MDRSPGGLTGERGRGVLDLGGLRAWEGLRGRARAAACIFFYPFFTTAAAYNTDNLCTKTEILHFFKPKICSL